MILGLDIGSNSIGWALLDTASATRKLIAAGVRVFEEGVNLDAKTGKTESRNVKRREARLRRRQVQRHAERKRLVRGLLAGWGWLPRGAPNHADPNWQNILDSDPYALRAGGLRRPLETWELGRVFYHLAERRGYLSNRKKPITKEEHGTVKDGIKKLEAELAASGAQTLGEYFSRLNPHEIRIRTHYTKREDYEKEFAALWSAQAHHHAATMTPEARARLHHALFFQRPLRIRGGQIGRCDLEPSKRRAPIYTLAAQEFRMLQDLNHLRIDDGTPGGRPLPKEAAEAIRAFQEVQGEVSFGKMRTKIRALKGSSFTLERGGEKNICGNDTAAQIRNAIGAKWDEMSERDRERLANDLASIESESAMGRRLAEDWGFSSAEVELLGRVHLEEGYASLSTSAIRKLLPHMREGKSYREAVDSVAWDTKPGAQQPLLPPAPDLRNPIVQRSMAEVRRVVNAIIKKYGLPQRIRVELARELKLNREDRAEHIQNMRQRETLRRQAKDELIGHGLTNPKARDIEKWLLHKECGGHCPYTGKQIGFAALFERAEFDVEHILPFSRSFDDSFANKTLCHVHANRVEKRNQTPFEVYGNTPEWTHILRRVGEFSGEYAAEKLRRFQIEDLKEEDSFLEGFTTRQLNDTKYASSLAAKQLRLLYPEDERLRAVQVSTGRVTAYLRNAWGLNAILSDGPRKSRDDHRHHAVDAICVALTEASTVKMLADASKRWNKRDGRVGIFRDTPLPWPGFFEDVASTVENIVVSHRVSRRVQGQLHKETHYGFIHDPNATAAKDDRVAVIRVRVQDLTPADVEEIVDKAVREAVIAKLNGGLPKNVFKNGQNLPVLITKTGRSIPIKKVRIRCGKMNLHDLGPSRKVVVGNNHHLAIYEYADKKGNKRWREVLIPMIEAIRRVRANEPLVPKADESGRHLVFSLVKGDTLELSWKDRRGRALVMGLSHSDYTLRWINDARPKSDLDSDLIRITSPSSLARCEPVKLSVDPIGQFHVSRD